MKNNGAVAERKSLLVSHRKKVAHGIPTTGIFLIAGAVKTGKSSLLAEFPNSYCISAEKEGMDYLEGRIHDVSNLNEFREVLVAVKEDKSIKTLCVDTIDAIADWIAADVAKEFGLTHINETKSGVSGYAVSGEFHKRMVSMVDWFLNCGKLVVLSAHYVEAKNDNGVKTPAKIAVRGKAAEYITYHSKIIGCTTKEFDGEKTNYLLSFQGDELRNWGSRIPEVQDKVITQGYENFANLFETKTKKKESK